MQLLKKVVEAANMEFGITKKQLKLKISRLCKAQRISTSFKRRIPGDDWWRGFKNRHSEMVFRKPENLSTSRSRMLNRVVVTKYFDDLGKIITENNLKGTQIWNMDEKPGNNLSTNQPMYVHGRVPEMSQAEQAIAGKT
jgi:hypothetical protein